MVFILLPWKDRFCRQTCSCSCTTQSEYKAVLSPSVKIFQKKTTRYFLTIFKNPNMLRILTPFYVVNVSNVFFICLQEFFLRTFSFRQQAPLAGPFLIPQTLSDTTSATIPPGNRTCQSRSFWTGGTRERSMRSKPDSIQGLRRRRAAPASRSLRACFDQ